MWLLNELNKGALYDCLNCTRGPGMCLELELHEGAWYVASV